MNNPTSAKSLRQVFIGFMFMVSASHAYSQQQDADVMQQAQTFLDSNKANWQDWNVPYKDGQILHDKIVDLGAKSILEIGTSTGHSTVWLARAAVQTGGKVTTIEIDPRRHDIAIDNFNKAGVTHLIDARLGDAHEFVPALTDKFDFVFSDADKNWYIQYFKDIAPNLNTGGCVATHNVLRNGGADIDRFLDYVNNLKDFTTNIVAGSGEGISFTCKKLQ